MSDIDERNRKRNAQAHQDRDRVKKVVHSQFDGLGLTKRNNDYMFKFYTELGKVDNKKISNDKKAAIVNQMVADLLQGQKEGKTARNMWGTVDQKLENTVNPPKKPAEFQKENYWINALYNMILFVTIFFLMYGAVGLFTPKTKQTSMGLTGIIFASIIAGLGIPLMTAFFTPGMKHRFNFWVRILIIIGFLVVWMVVFMLAGFIPAIINPVLNPAVYLGIGLATAAGSYFFKQRYRDRLAGTLF